LDIFRIEAGKVVEYWDVMQEKVPAAETAATPCSHGARETRRYRLRCVAISEEARSAGP
jgi:hypothetical protein